MGSRLRDLVAKYGRIALAVHLTIFALVFGGAAAAITLGLDIGTSAAGAGGTLATAYIATQIVKPVRIGATLILTPFIGTLLQRGPQANPPAPIAALAETTDEVPDDLPAPLTKQPSGHGAT